MNVPKRLIVGAILALVASVAGAPLAPAEPLNPLSPAEMEYLGQLHHVFSKYRDPTAFRSDGELLRLGRYVCRQREMGLVGYEATLVTSAIAQLAPIYLCPN